MNGWAWLAVAAAAVAVTRRASPAGPDLGAKPGPADTAPAAYSLSGDEVDAWDRSSRHLMLARVREARGVEATVRAARDYAVLLRDRLGRSLDLKKTDATRSRGPCHCTVWAAVWLLAEQAARRGAVAPSTVPSQGAPICWARYPGTHERPAGRQSWEEHHPTAPAFTFRRSDAAPAVGAPWAGPWAVASTVQLKTNWRTYDCSLADARVVAMALTRALRTERPAWALAAVKAARATATGEFRRFLEGW